MGRSLGEKTASCFSPQFADGEFVPVIQLQSGGDLFEVLLHPFKSSGCVGVAPQIESASFFLGDPVRAEMDLHFVLRRV